MSVIFIQHITIKKSLTKVNVKDKLNYLYSEILKRIPENVLMFLKMNLQVCLYLQGPWKLVFLICCWRCGRRARPGTDWQQEDWSVWSRWVTWGSGMNMDTQDCKRSEVETVCCHTGSAETDSQSCFLKCDWWSSLMAHYICHTLRRRAVCRVFPRRIFQDRPVYNPVYSSQRLGSWLEVYSHR